MHRSTTDHDTSLGNVAEAYMALSNETPYHLPRPFPGNGKIMAGAVAVQSCVSDLLTLYKALMEAADDQGSRRSTSTPDNPLKQVQTIRQAHIPLSPDSVSSECSYALGWIRAELSTTLGAIGLNPEYVEQMPVVGKGLEESQLCFYHQGSSNTFVSSVHLLPKSHTAIVVLTNSMANSDADDWLGEMFLEAVLDNREKDDYLQLAMASTAESLNRWGRMPQDLKEKRVPNTAMESVYAYCGTYVNRVGTYYIDVFQHGNQPGQLRLCFQGDRTCRYK